MNRYTFPVGMQEDSRLEGLQRQLRKKPQGKVYRKDIKTVHFPEEVLTL